MIDARIAMGIRPPDIVNALARGTQAASSANQVQRQNQLAQLYREAGPGIMAGDQGALNRLAQFSPQEALGVQQTQQQMRVTDEQLKIARQNAATAAQNAATAENRERLAQEAAEAERIISMALADPQNADTYFAQSEHTQGFVGKPPEVAAASVLGVKDALEMRKESEPNYQALPGGQVVDMNNPTGGVVEVPGYQPQKAERFRQATPEEAAQFGAQAGQFGPDGRFYPVNPADEMVMEVGPDGSTTFRQGPAQPGKPAKTTEGEKSAAGYLGRMRDAEAEMDALAQEGGPQVRSLASLLVAGTNFEGLVLSAGQERLLQAMRDWVRAKLRKESGAVIGDVEMAEEIRTYFPLPGEDAKTIEQKRRARQAAERQMETMAGAAEAKTAGLATDTAVPESFAANPTIQRAAEQAGVTVEEIWKHHPQNPVNQ